jgi:hypothetical protein
MARSLRKFSENSWCASRPSARACLVGAPQAVWGHGRVLPYGIELVSKYHTLKMTKCHIVKDEFHAIGVYRSFGCDSLRQP